MEVKSNVRQRRMNRMKQIVASEQAEDHRDVPLVRNSAARYRGIETSYRRNEDENSESIDRADSGESPLYRGGGPLYRDERYDDPEYIWKSQEKERWTSLERATFRSSGTGRDSRTLTPPTVRQIWFKLGISAVLFAAVWGMFQIDHPAAERGKSWVRAALHEDYDFQAAAAWYERRFGGLPAFLPAIRAKSDPEAQKASSASLQKLYAPVHGKIMSKAEGDELGITIRTEPEAAVATIDTGRVVAVNVGTDKATTIHIQHAGGIQSIYGWITGTSLKINDWVKGGETIGKVTTDAAGGAGKLYVAIKKDNQYVHPAEVISFD